MDPTTVWEIIYRPERVIYRSRENITLCKMLQNQDTSKNTIYWVLLASLSYSYDSPVFCRLVCKLPIHWPVTFSLFIWSDSIANYVNIKSYSLNLLYIWKNLKFFDEFSWSTKLCYWSVNLPWNKYLEFWIPLCTNIIKRHEILKRFSKINVPLMFWLGNRVQKTFAKHQHKRTISVVLTSQSNIN